MGISPLFADHPHIAKGDVMTVSTFIRTKIIERNISQKQLADRSGFKNQSNISTILKVNNMHINNLFALLDALDCELIIRDKVTGVENVISKE